MLLIWLIPSSGYVYLQDHKALTLTRVTADIERFAEKNNTNDARFLLAGSNAGIEAATNAMVKRSHLPMLVLVYTAAILLCFITFRSGARWSAPLRHWFSQPFFVKH
jgi:predicted RND superfamily exporter protein